MLRYDAATLRPRRPALTGHTEPVRDVAFSHKGRLLATSSDDGSAIVWDARTGGLLHRYAGSAPLAVAFSADDQTVFTAGADGLLLAWNVPRASQQLALGEDTSAALDADYSLSLPAPDGHTVARMSSGKLSFANTVTGRRTRPIPAPDETFVWAPDAPRWLLSYGSDRVTVWDASTGSVAARSAPFGEHPQAAFGPDAREVYVLDNGSLHTLTRESLLPAHPAVPVGADSTVVVPHALDGSVFVFDRYVGSLVRMNPRTGDVLATAPDGLLFDEDQGLVMSPDGTRMVVPGPGRRVRLLDVDKLELVGTDSKSQWDSSPAFAPDGSQFALAQEERIRLWDGRTGEYQASLPLPSRTGTVSIVYLPDSTGLVIASTDGRTWTVDTRRDAWVARACATAGRNLSQEEWEQFFPNLPYERTCPQWPTGT